MSEPTHHAVRGFSAIAVSLGLLLVLGGCSCDSSFWDRSPCVGGVKQPVCGPPVQQAPSCGCAPRQQAQPRVGDPLAPPDDTYAARPPAVPRTAAGPTSVDMDVLNEVNRIRFARGIRPLGFEMRLWNSAHDHSSEQMQHGYMGHGSPDPRRDNLTKRVKLAGYEGRAYGEVVAWGYRDCRAVVEGWMNSPAHRAVLLDRDMTQVGFSRSGLYWTGNFGAADYPGLARVPREQPVPRRQAAPSPQPRPQPRPQAPRPQPKPRSIQIAPPANSGFG